MKLYEVELRAVIVVAADSEEDALDKCNNSALQRDVVRDNPLEVEVQHEIEEIDSLPYGWEGGCIPYGGDGDTTIAAWYGPYDGSA